MLSKFIVVLFRLLVFRNLDKNLEIFLKVNNNKFLPRSILSLQLSFFTYQHLQ